MTCKTASAFIGVLKCCEKGVKKTIWDLRTIFSWKALAPPKHSLEIPDNMKIIKFKHGSEIKSTCPYEGTGFGHFLVRGWLCCEVEDAT